MTALFGQILMVFCSTFLTLVIFMLTMFIQNIPAISNLLEGILSGFLQASYLVYHFVLDRFTSIIGINVPTSIWRLITTSLLSLSIYLVICLVFRFSLRLWIAGLSVAHGFYIGLAWDKLSDPDGLDLGKRMK